MTRKPADDVNDAPGRTTTNHRPPAGASRLKHILGRPAALHYLLTCAELSAPEALRIGFAQPMPADGAAALPAHPGNAVVGAMKRALQDSRDQDILRQELRAEVEVFAALWATVRHQKRQSPKA